MTTRYYSVLGLGFGDCGKGLVTDSLVRRVGAHTVVRFNGGAQAGHNVVLQDGRHHTFSQFGAGSFVPGVATLLAEPVVVHPTALRVEAEALARAGGDGRLERLMIDARCRVTTPFHQAAGRLRERARGAAAHGSCGVGVGETVRATLRDSAAALRYGDLLRPALARAKLAQLQDALRDELAAAARPGDRDAEALRDPALADRWLAAASVCIQASPPASRDAIGARLALPGAVVFEGAQGVLLDEWRGFHPHTTWSTVSTAAVDGVLADAGIAARVRHVGVLRSYLTRHGAGPLPTHDAALDALPEPHNPHGGWQGRFRRGHPDLVLLRYALDVIGPLVGIVATHLDIDWQRAALRFCDGYRGLAVAGCRTDASGSIVRLGVTAAPDLDYQQALTRLLGSAEPRLGREPIEGWRAWIEQVQAVAGLPVAAGAFGPTHADVIDVGAPTLHRC